MHPPKGIPTYLLEAPDLPSASCLRTRNRYFFGCYPALLPRLEIPLRDVTPRGDVFPCRGKERNTTWIGRGEKDETKASSRPSDLGDARSRGVHSNAFALHRRLYYVCTTRVLYNFAREISVSLSAVDSTRVSSSIDSAIDSLVLYESTGGIIARQEETVSLRFFRPTIAT